MPATTPPISREPGITNTFNPAVAQTSESPPRLAYMTAGDTAYPCYYLDYSKPSTVVSDVRPTISAAIGIKRDQDLDLIRTVLRGGTIALLTTDGRTITATDVKVESYKDLSIEPGFVPNLDGSSIVLLKLSCDSRLYRST